MAKFKCTRTGQVLAAIETPAAIAAMNPAGYENLHFYDRFMAGCAVAVKAPTEVIEAAYQEWHPVCNNGGRIL